AIETYIQYMIEENREREILRPVSIEAQHEFLTEGTQLEESYPYQCISPGAFPCLSSCPVRT
ncbi:hypothetical protein M1N13_04100, partial [Dehalococcoidia bacterium]|nr:hypothetical protein [Dehalococcoidia bacterium]